MGEFDLIARYFTRRPQRALLGVGDDCALLQPRPGTQMAISCDMLVEGRHFFANVDPESLGHKALAVNLSDLAACGARPLAFTLALALPEVDEAWLSAFSRGLFALADAHSCELIGGDTTQGPLNICITVFGETEGQPLLRSGAQVGDEIYVSGQLGDAHLALQGLLGRITLPADLLAQTRQRLERPDPRVALGLALRGLASAAIDVSDGLVGDIGHLLKASGVGATLEAAALAPLLGAGAHPAWPALAQSAIDHVLAGGDDYELAFTAPASARDALTKVSEHTGVRLSRIGRIEAEPGLRLVDAQGQAVDYSARSFDHFAPAP
jgi:thiamine-monophosphate kinase